MSVGKKYVTKDDLEAFARKLIRRITGATIGLGGGGAGSGGVFAFLNLVDVPGSYSGEGLKGVRVNAAEDALEFFDLDLNSLSDVDLESAHAPSDGDVLVFDAASSRWIPQPCDCSGGLPSGGLLLDDLGDVDLQSGYAPSDGDVLTYVASIGRWVASPPVGGVIDFTDLSDVPASYVAEALKAVRVNAAETELEFFDLDLDALSDVDLQSAHVPMDGDLLTYDAGTSRWIPLPPAVPSGGGISNLCDLLDVDCDSPFVPIEGDVLRYDGSSGLWIPTAISGGADHDLLSATHPDTIVASPLAGDLIYGNATPKWTKLAAGAEGKILEMGATLPGWGRKITISASDPSGGSDGDIWMKY